jgi:hypothetical protein
VRGPAVSAEMEGYTTRDKARGCGMTELLIVIGCKDLVSIDVVLPILPVAEEFKTVFGHSG